MDIHLFFLINRGMANPLFDVFMPALTRQGYLLVLPVAIYVLFAGFRTRTPSGRTYFPMALAAVVIALIAFPLADAAGNWLKELIARPRPCQELDGVRLLVHCSSSFSMPSGHSTVSFAFAVPLFVLTRPFLQLCWRVFPLLIAAAVAFSRPYLGVHYPSDILAGAALGSSVAGVMCWAYCKAAQRYQPS